MPELPEVETVRRGLEKSILKQAVKSVELRRAGLRAPFPPHFAAALEGQSVVSLRRRAKYILADLSNAHVWLIHLGMSGSFRILPRGTNTPPEPHDHVILTFENGMTLIYNDPRRFGQMDVFPANAEHTHPALAKLGPEPLEQSFDGPALAQCLSGKKTPIKLALLDQSVVSGVGNIYACEALYRAGIHPKKMANTIKGEKLQKLASAIADVMRAALRSGGSTLRDHRLLDGSTGYFQHSFDVYDRKGQACGQCTCGGTKAVQAIVQGGRTTFFCPHKQKAR